MFVDTDPIGQAIYIINRASRTVYETSLAGSYSNSYRAYNEDDFASLANVVDDPNLGVIYVLSGNNIDSKSKEYLQSGLITKCYAKPLKINDIDFILKNR